MCHFLLTPRPVIRQAAPSILSPRWAASCLRFGPSDKNSRLADVMGGCPSLLPSWHTRTVPVSRDGWGLSSRVPPAPRINRRNHAGHVPPTRLESSFSDFFFPFFFFSPPSSGALPMTQTLPPITGELKPISISPRRPRQKHTQPRLRFRRQCAPGPRLPRFCAAPGRRAVISRPVITIFLEPGAGPEIQPHELR